MILLPPRSLLSFTHRIHTSTTPKAGLLISSIGNPEPKYTNTRHNAGHRMMDQLINKYWSSHIIPQGNNLYKSKKFQNILLFKSNNEYMNLQGKPISKVFHDVKGQYSQLIVLHDELQVPIGKYQIRKAGTSARGHNGLKSIDAHMKKHHYLKIGIGIGRPVEKDTTLHVLSKFNPDESEIIDYQVIPQCVEELEKLIEASLQKTQGKEKEFAIRHHINDKDFNKKH